MKFNVKGMHCKSCEIILKEELEELDGIIDVQASHKKNEVFVKFDKTKINEEIIKKTIKKEGYEI